MSKEINPNKVLFDQLLEDAYRAGLYTDIKDIQGDSWTVWKIYNEDRIKELSSKLSEEAINSVSSIDDWEDISTAPINVWLVCRNANKRVFEAMKCSTVTSLVNKC